MKKNRARPSRLARRLGLGLTIAGLPLACTDGPRDDHQAAQGKPRPPVELVTPEMKGLPPYEPAAIVVWVGTDGIAVTPTLSPAADVKPIVPLTGGRLSTNPGDSHYRIRALFDVLAPAAASQRGARPPFPMALVVDRRVGVETLAAVIGTAQLAGLWEVRLVFDPMGTPTMFRADAFDPEDLHFQYAALNLQIELRREGSSLTVPYDDERRPLQLGGGGCAFERSEEIQPAVLELCTDGRAHLNVELVADASLIFADIAGLLARSPIPATCAAYWVLGSTADLSAPRCAEAVTIEAAKKALPFRHDPNDPTILDLFNAGEDSAGLDDIFDTAGLPESEIIDNGIGIAIAMPDRPETTGETAKITTYVHESSGGLSDFVLGRIIHAHHRELIRCAESDGLLAATIELQLTVGTDGKVSTARTRSDDASLGKVPACMVKRAKRWKFPKTPDVAAQVTYNVLVGAI